MSDHTEWVPYTEELMSKVPQGAQLVKTRDGEGRARWKAPEDVLQSDLIGTIHNAPLIMMKRPGRPKKGEEPAALSHPSLVGEKAVKRAPDALTEDEKERRAEARKRKEIEAKIRRQNFYRKDALLQTILNDPDSEDVPAQILKEVAAESAALAYERLKAEKSGDGKEASQLSIRRMKGLQAIQDGWYKRQEHRGQRTIDLNSPVFLALLEFMLLTFKESMVKGGVTPDQVQTTLTELSARFGDESWVNEAKHVMSKAPRS